MRNVNRNPMFAAFALITAAAFATGAATAENLYTSGHGDLGIGYHDGALDLHVHLEGGIVNGAPQDDVEFEADNLIIVVPLASREPRPADAAFAPIGVGPNVDYWKLPQTEAEADSEGAPFLGIGSGELDPADWIGDLTLQVTGVTSPSGSDYYSIFQQGITPTFQVSTFDPAATLNGDNSFPLLIGGHDHFNHGFTEAGDWQVTLAASAEHALDGPVTGSATYTFRVVPEPAGIMLLALGVAALRRR